MFDSSFFGKIIYWKLKKERKKLKTFDSSFFDKIMYGTLERNWKLWVTKGAS